jgi:hypothetical protein
MYSESKQLDREMMNDIGEMMITLTKFLYQDGVENAILGFNKTYEELKLKIATHDYSKENEIDERIRGYFNYKS